MPVMMKCGHTANANQAGKPVCAICYGIRPGANEVENELPSLDGRTACCPDCGKKTTSNFNLPFFSYQPNQQYDSYYCGCYGWD